MSFTEFLLRYDGGQQLPADTYGHMEISATEEPYSALGYGDNTQYIQPDGINPYDESSGEKHAAVSFACMNCPFFRFVFASRYWGCWLRPER